MTTHGYTIDLTDRAAIVTGASSGLGVAFARALAGAGASVALAARRTERLEALAAEIEERGGSAIALTCDVADASQVASMVEATTERFGRLDVLVNNAGIVPELGVMPEHVPDELFEHTLRVNLTGAWYCAREAARHMLPAGRGTIVNIASIAGLGGWQNFPVAYQASKAALINLTRALAVSWGDRGVRVNAIAPGWFPSEMTDPILTSSLWRPRVEGQAPLRRVGEPHELDGALLFLASEASSYVTGQTLVVDGGTSASLGAPAYTEEIFAFHAAAAPDGLGEPIAAAMALR